MKELDMLTDRAHRIATTQRIFLDDTTGRTEALAIWGHDKAHVGARAWGMACRALLNIPRHWRPDMLIQTSEQWRTVARQLAQPGNPPGLVNQILDGATLRAGLVIGAVIKCTTPGCEGRIEPGEHKCATCSAPVSLQGHRRCHLCLNVLDGRLPANVTQCKTCVKTAERAAKQCQHYRKRTTDAGRTYTCTDCGIELA